MEDNIQTAAPKRRERFVFEHAKLRGQFKKELLEKMPWYDRTAENRILFIEEIQNELPDDCEIIGEHKCGICFITTIKEVKNKYFYEVYNGGEGVYLGFYLSHWRLWFGNPPVKQILTTPWLEDDDVLNYNATFIKDKTVQKFFAEEHDFPNTSMRKFWHYYDEKDE